VGHEDLGTEEFTLQRLQRLGGEDLDPERFARGDGPGMNAAGDGDIFSGKGGVRCRRQESTEEQGGEQ